MPALQLEPRHVQLSGVLPNTAPLGQDGLGVLDLVSRQRPRFGDQYHKIRIQVGGHALGLPCGCLFGALAGGVHWNCLQNFGGGAANVVGRGQFFAGKQRFMGIGEQLLQDFPVLLRDDGEGRCGLARRGIRRWG